MKKNYDASHTLIFLINDQQREGNPYKCSLNNRICDTKLLMPREKNVLKRVGTVTAGKL